MIHSSVDVQDATVLSIDELVYFDVPEDNPSAMALVSEHNMTEVFGYARVDKA